MRQPPVAIRMTAARPIAPRSATTTTTKPAPSRDNTQDSQIANLQERVSALEQLVQQLTQFISVNHLNELVISANGNIFIQSSGTVQIGATVTKLSTTRFDIASPITNASGVIQTQTIIADNVVGKSYTPGAGNIW